MASKIPKPDKTQLYRLWILDEMADHIKAYAEEHPLIDFDLLSRTLRSVSHDQLDSESQLRAFGAAFCKTDEFQVALDALDETTRAQIKNFIDGTPVEELHAGGKPFYLPPSLQARHHFSLLDFMKKFGKKFFGDHATQHGLPVIYENEQKTKVMEVYSDIPFENWGLTVKNKPKYTFIPTKIHGIQNLVQFARENGHRIRCSGYRHSWSPCFGDDGEILVSMLNLQQATSVPEASELFPTPEPETPNELKSISFVDDTIYSCSLGNKLLRVGAAVTTEELRRYLVKDPKWALQVDTILVEVTIAGVNGTICHGGGLPHKTINDQVRIVEYVDCTGVHRVVSDPVHISAAAGCFGLLGVVTHLTFEVKPMRYALMRPCKPDIALCIPPLTPDDVPPALRKSWTEKYYNDAYRDFIDRVSNDFYCEWFWPTYSQEGWVNTWKASDDSTGLVEYPSHDDTWLQWVQGLFGGMLTTSPFFIALPGRWQACLLGTLELSVLPPFDPDEKDLKITTLLTNGLHFRRGVQNMRCEDLELEIPIPALATDPNKPDYSILQRAWWDIINLVYKDVECPMRLMLEMRVMADSDIIMASQHGNKFGTCSIEILSIPDAENDGEWQAFKQQVLDIWMSYTNSEGKPLNSRPHWGKEWKGLKFNGMPAEEYFKIVAYKDAIRKFKDVLADIGKTQGWTLNDIKTRFSNKTWDKIIFE